MAFFNILLFSAIVNNVLLETEGVPAKESSKNVGITIYNSSGIQCVQSNNCYSSEKCANNTCIHVCENEPLVHRELCFGNNHTIVRFCKTGYVYNEANLCTASCTDSAECNTLEECYLEENLVGWCGCQHMYIRDIYHKTKCELSRICHDDNACQYFERCVNNECINVCSEYNCSNSNEGCLASEHRAECACKSNYYKNRNGKCVEDGCFDDSDCSLYEECVLADGFRQCMCVVGYEPDFTKNGTCRLRCLMYVGFCPKNFWCNGSLCIPCDGRICNQTAV